MPRLRRSDCASPGISRRRRGRGHEYLDPDGERIDDPEALERIHALAIPPAWRDVWICMDPYGHLQATGFDAAGRKQYLYHERWRAHRDRQKFDSMIAFGHALRGLRTRVKRDLRLPAGEAAESADRRLSRERVLACAVRLLDVGFFRIGSEDYAERNESFGLTTMLRKHVAIEGEQLVFDFPAKSGQRRVQAIADADALELVSELKRRRSGSQLLAYREDGRWQELDAEEVNDYIKRHGGSFTAKDFRTWNATVLAAVALAAPDAVAQTRVHASAGSGRRSRRWRPTSATRRPCAGPPTWILACSTAIATGRRSRPRCSSSRGTARTSPTSVCAGRSRRPCSSCSITRPARWLIPRSCAESGGADSRAGRGRRPKALVVPRPRPRTKAGEG